MSLLITVTKRIQARKTECGDRLEGVEPVQSRQDELKQRPIRRF